MSSYEETEKTESPNIQFPISLPSPTYFSLSNCSLQKSSSSESLSSNVPKNSSPATPSNSSSSPLLTQPSTNQQRQQKSFPLFCGKASSNPTSSQFSPESRQTRPTTVNLHPLNVQFLKEPYGPEASKIISEESKNVHVSEIERWLNPDQTGSWFSDQEGSSGRNSPDPILKEEELFFHDISCAERHNEEKETSQSDSDSLTGFKHATNCPEFREKIPRSQTCPEELLSKPNSYKCKKNSLKFSSRVPNIILNRLHDENPKLLETRFVKGSSKEYVCVTGINDASLKRNYSNNPWENSCPSFAKYFLSRRKGNLAPAKSKCELEELELLNSDEIDTEIFSSPSNSKSVNKLNDNLIDSQSLENNEKCLKNPEPNYFESTENLSFVSVSGTGFSPISSFEKAGRLEKCPNTAFADSQRSCLIDSNIKMSGKKILENNHQCKRRTTSELEIISGEDINCRRDTSAFINFSNNGQSHHRARNKISVQTHCKRASQKITASVDDDGRGEEIYRYSSKHFLLLRQESENCLNVRHLPQDSGLEKYYWQQRERSKFSSNLSSEYQKLFADSNALFKKRKCQSLKNLKSKVASPQRSEELCSRKSIVKSSEGPTESLLKKRVMDENMAILVDVEVHSSMDGDGKPDQDEYNESKLPKKETRDSLEIPNLFYTTFSQSETTLLRKIESSSKAQDKIDPSENHSPNFLYEMRNASQMSTQSPLQSPSIGTAKPENEEHLIDHCPSISYSPVLSKDLESVSFMEESFLRTPPPLQEPLSVSSNSSRDTESPPLVSNSSDKVPHVRESITDPCESPRDSDSPPLLSESLSSSFLATDALLGHHSLLPKLQVCEKGGRWWALNAAVLMLYRKLCIQGKCFKVKAEVINLNKVRILLRSMHFLKHTVGHKCRAFLLLSKML